MLGLPNHDQSLIAAAVITAALEQCVIQEEARRKVSDVKAARRRLDHIATVSRRLSKLLDEEPLAGELAVESGWIFRFDPSDEIDVGRIFNDARKRVVQMRADLAIISSNAARLAESDQDFRAAHMLPRADQAGRSTPTLWLWPKLFETWEHAGKRVAATPDGPLHCFVKFVHRVADLPGPNANTLKDAVEEWQHGGRAARFASRPPWWFEG